MGLIAGSAVVMGGIRWNYSSGGAVLIVLILLMFILPFVLLSVLVLLVIAGNLKSQAAEALDRAFKKLPESWSTRTPEAEAPALD